MELKNVSLNSNNMITSNPLHSESSNSLVSFMLNPNTDTMTNFIINDHISDDSGIR